jgi:hypothetical protein
MGRLIDLTSQRFGRLLVIRKVKAKSHASSYWECICDCGTVKIISGAKMRRGVQISCGCYRKQRRGITAVNYKHGYAHPCERTYKTWKEMRQRCYNPRKSNYRYYGKKGIRVCDRWKDFCCFVADMGERPLSKTLDRINPDGDYTPDNCRWATPLEQASTNRGLFKKGMAPWNKRLINELK